MKEFNLNEYLKNPSQKVVTRDGRNVRIISTDKKGFNPILALVTRHDSITEDIYLYTKNGELSEDNLTKSRLFFAPEKHEGWVNVYRIGGLSCGRVFDSEEKARQGADEGAIATAKIEWEE